MCLHQYWQHFCLVPATLTDASVVCTQRQHTDVEDGAHERTAPCLGHMMEQSARGDSALHIDQHAAGRDTPPCPEPPPWGPRSCCWRPKAGPPCRLSRTSALCVRSTDSIRSLSTDNLAGHGSREHPPLSCAWRLRNPLQRQHKRSTGSVSAVSGGQQHSGRRRSAGSRIALRTRASHKKQKQRVARRGGGALQGDLHAARKAFLLVQDFHFLADVRGLDLQRDCLATRCPA